MKLLKIFAIAAAGITSVGASTAVLAQTMTPTGATNGINAANATAAQWASSQADAPATRAQVYQALVQAEKDGQLKYLNATVYAHH